MNTNTNTNTEQETSIPKAESAWLFACWKVSSSIEETANRYFTAGHYLKASKLYALANKYMNQGEDLAIHFHKITGLERWEDATAYSLGEVMRLRQKQLACL